jgi:hypothetical protein
MRWLSESSVKGATFGVCRSEVIKQRVNVIGKRRYLSRADLLMRCLFVLIRDGCEEETVVTHPAAATIIVM